MVPLIRVAITAAASIHGTPTASKAEGNNSKHRRAQRISLKEPDGSALLLVAGVAVLSPERLDDKPAADRACRDADLDGPLGPVIVDEHGVDLLDVGPKRPAGDAGGLEAEAAFADFLTAPCTALAVTGLFT